MKIFITGSTGFVGSHVAAALKAQEHDAVALVRGAEEKKAIEDKGYDAIMADLDDTDAYMEQLATCDAIFHGAASNHPDWPEINSRFIHEVADKLAGTGKVFAMQAGSMVFGDTQNQILDERSAQYSPPPPLAGRVQLEQDFLALRSKEIQSCILYGSFVYGGAGAAIPAILEATSQQEGYVSYVGEGTTKWAVVHIQDWAELITKALVSSPSPKYFASAELLSAFQIATILGKKLGLETRSISPDQLNDKWGFFTQPFAFMSQAFSGKYARTDLGWQPVYTFDKEAVE
ncbi:MAG: NAD-dependent epimerase/dehydratase family protein [Bacteroidota bacterium]